MTNQRISTRRSFLRGSALLAAPLALGLPAVASAAGVAGAIPEDAHHRLVRMEDEQAIRNLHQSWMRHINAGANDAAAQLFAEPITVTLEGELRSIAPDHHGEPDKIEIAPDGQHASACFACSVEIATMIPPTNTLAQMAHAQGCGFVHETQQRQAMLDYVKTSRGWIIADLIFARV